MITLYLVSAWGIFVFCYLFFVFILYTFRGLFNEVVIMSVNCHYNVIVMLKHNLASEHKVKILNLQPKKSDQCHYTIVAIPNQLFDPNFCIEKLITLYLYVVRGDLELFICFHILLLYLVYSVGVFVEL